MYDVLTSFNLGQTRWPRGPPETHLRVSLGNLQLATLLCLSQILCDLRYSMAFSKRSGESFPTVFFILYILCVSFPLTYFLFGLACSDPFWGQDRSTQIVGPCKLHAYRLMSESIFPCEEPYREFWTLKSLSQCRVRPPLATKSKHLVQFRIIGTEMVSKTSHYFEY